MEDELKKEHLEDVPNILEMSDEDVAGIDVPEESSTVDTQTEEEILDEKIEEDIPDKVSEEEEPEELIEARAPEADESVEEAEKTSEKSSKEPSEVSEASEEDTPVDYEKEYNKILAPFRANGKEIKVDSIEDAISLMSMGANYNKKMASLKPSLKIVKMLQNNNLLDESKLNYLIDLDKKNPEAIRKLLKDSELDPLDINTEDDTVYQPNTYNVDDKQVDLDRVLEDIQDSPSFNDTVDIISNKWDESSRQVLVDNPAIIQTINDHVASGVYGQIAQVVESERMLGRLTNISDIEAYRQVGDAIQAKGGFNTPNLKANENIKSAGTKPKTDPKLKNRKKAAGTTKAVTKTTKVDPNFNPLNLSDEEFEKIASSNYM
jgi:hypothetical protein